MERTTEIVSPEPAVFAADDDLDGRRSTCARVKTADLPVQAYATPNRSRTASGFGFRSNSEVANPETLLDRIRRAFMHDVEA